MTRSSSEPKRPRLLKRLLPSWWYGLAYDTVWCFFHNRHPKLLEVPRAIWRKLLCHCPRCGSSHRQEHSKVIRSGFYWLNWQEHWLCETCEDWDFYREMKAHAEGW